MAILTICCGRPHQAPPDDVRLPRNKRLVERFADSRIEAVYRELSRIRRGQRFPVNYPTDAEAILFIGEPEMVLDSGVHWREDITRRPSSDRLSLPLSGPGRFLFWETELNHWRGFMVSPDGYIRTRVLDIRAR